MSSGMNRGLLWAAAGLLLAVSLSAIAVAHTKFQTRIHFSELQGLRAERDALDVEWNRLRLEEAALSSQAIMERRARDELGMYVPRMEDVLLIEETGDGTR
jgi:cell division protein FtsL